PPVPPPAIDISPHVPTFINPNPATAPLTTPINSVVGLSAGMKPMPSVMPKKGHRALLFIFLLLIIGGGASAYYFRENLKTLPVVRDFFSKELVITPIEEQVNVSSQANQNDQLLINTNQVGMFRVGDLIPSNDSLSKSGYSIKEESGMGPPTVEGGPKESALIVSQYGKDLLHIYPVLYPDSSNRIGEIRVVSSEFKTEEEIFVGLTMSDFIKIYPDFKIWYTYVGDMFVLETPKYLGVQFLLDKTGFINSKKTLGRTEVDILTQSDFNNNTIIESIRVYYTPIINDTNLILPRTN
ncbi:MAG: hypothetical protein Q8O46_05720, partial [bacterium]|nr:hypothetical protein [bacterium]